MSTVARFAERLQSARPVPATVVAPRPIDPQEQLAEAFARARVDGYAAGLEDAAAEVAEGQRRQLAEQALAHEQWQQEIQCQRQSVAAGLRALADQATVLRAQALELALELGFQAACALIGQRAVDRQLVADLLADAVHGLDDQVLQVRVGKSLSGLAEAPEGVVVSADPSLPAWGCVVEGRRGQRASDLARRLEELTAQLLRTLETRDASVA